MINRNKPLILSLLFSICAFFVQAQEVITLTQHADIADGLYVSPDGKVFTTCGGLVRKTSIGMYDPATSKFELISNDMLGSIDIASIDGQVLYVTNYDDNSVRRFDRSSGETTVLTKGLDGPAGIEVDQDGNLYVTNFGAPPTYSGNTVMKIAPDGTKEVLLESDQLVRPQGLGWFDKNTLLVANSNKGQLFLLNVNTRKLSIFADTGLPLGNIAIGKEKIYIASNRGHRILVFNRRGELIQTYGNEERVSKDGKVEEANFANPLGVALSPDEKILYVAQIHSGLLRAVLFED